MTYETPATETRDKENERIFIALRALEGDSEWSRELDIVVAEALGIRIRRYWKGDGWGEPHVITAGKSSNAVNLPKLPSYALSVDAAKTAIPSGWTRAVDATAPELGIDVDLFAPGSGASVRGTHISEARATCIAALLAYAETLKEAA